MEQNYLIDKKVKKKSAIKGIWLATAFGIVFLLILVKFANSGSMDVFSGLPDSDAAYDIAKTFIRPTVRSTNVTFNDGSYKFAKQSDSVYVIKSFYEAKDGDSESSITNFTITLKYNGHHSQNESNWSLLNLDQE
jgi:hypothetical protein